ALGPPLERELDSRGRGPERPRSLREGRETRSHRSPAKRIRRGGTLLSVEGPRSLLLVPVSVRDLEMGLDVEVETDFLADLLLDERRDLVRALDRPVARKPKMKIAKGPASPAAQTQAMELHRVETALLLEHRANAALELRVGSVHEPID